ncbi:MAG: AAA family ATPase, partial [Xenococcaceae cyanobacterium]
MYLKEILLENVGSINFLDLSLPFNEDNTPQPIVVVGSSGSGKSIFLSYIVDALIEFAKLAYLDIVPEQTPMLSHYFKISGGSNQKLNSEFSIGLLDFIEEDRKYSYVDKTGKLDVNSYRDKTKGRFELVHSW